MKKFFTIILSAILTIGMCFCFAGCKFKNGTSFVHGKWYIRSLFYEGETYSTQHSKDELFLDRYYPLTYDCFVLYFFDDGRVELSGVELESVTGSLTDYVNVSLNGDSRFEFTLGDKEYSGRLESTVFTYTLTVTEKLTNYSAVFERNPTYHYSYKDYLEDTKENPQDFFVLQNHLTKEDLLKIDTVEYSGSISPTNRAPTEYKTSEMQEDIQTVYDWLMLLNDVTLTETSELETQVEGGSEKVMTVYTKLGTFQIREGAKTYLHIGDRHFVERYTKMPDIIGESVTYRFDYSEDEKLHFYKWSNTISFCSYNIKLSDIEFKKCNDYLEMIDIGFSLKQDVGTLILYSEKVFYHVETENFYEIVGFWDFSQIFKENESLTEKDLQNIEILKAKYEEKNNPNNAIASVINYYGEFSSGAIVAMMDRTDMNYTQAEWTESVAGRVINYGDGNRIMVLYNGEFFNLPTAYDNGYLTEDEAHTVAMKHIVFNYFEDTV